MKLSVCAFKMSADHPVKNLVSDEAERENVSPPNDLKNRPGKSPDS